MQEFPSAQISRGGATPNLSDTLLLRILDSLERKPRSNEWQQKLAPALVWEAENTPRSANVIEATPRHISLAVCFSSSLSDARGSP